MALTLVEANRMVQAAIAKANVLATSEGGTLLLRRDKGDVAVL